MQVALQTLVEHFLATCGKNKPDELIVTNEMGRVVGCFRKNPYHSRPVTYEQLEQMMEAFQSVEDSYLVEPSPGDVP